MPKAFVKADTYLKQRLLSSTDLTRSERILMKEGREFFVTNYAPDRNQHLVLTLASPLTADDGTTRLQRVFAYDPHISIEGEEATQVIKLPVVYRSQLDNDPSIFGPGWRQCNTTANTMMADYVLKGDLSRQALAQGYKEPESLYMRLVAKYGDTIDHSAQTRALRDLGIESYFSYTMSAEDVLTCLRSDVPVVAGFAYKSSGHICVIVGHDPVRKVWLVNDPFGARHGASDSYDVGVGGAFDEYSQDTMQRIFWDQGREAGWGRVITSVKGRSTGLRAGM